MSAFGTVEAEFEHELQLLLTKAKSIGHHVTADLEAVWAKVHQSAAVLVGEAKADATQVVHDGEAAMGPVLTEVEKDATRLESEAATDVQQDITPPTAS